MTKATLRGKGFMLEVMVHRGGGQGRNLETRNDTDTMEERLLLARSPALAQLVPPSPFLTENIFIQYILIIVSSPWSSPLPNASNSMPSFSLPLETNRQINQN